jgi:VanZ family protein
MTTAKPGRGKGWWLRLVLWFVVLGLWTVALETPHPVRVSEAVLPPGARYLAAKTLHVTAYAVLAATAPFLGLGRGRWWLLALLSLHGAATEFFQQFVPTRTASFTDVGFDHLGIVLGFLVAWRGWVRPQPPPG